MEIFKIRKISFETTFLHILSELIEQKTTKCLTFDGISYRFPIRSKLLFKILSNISIELGKITPIRNYSVRPHLDIYMPCIHLGMRENPWEIIRCELLVFTSESLEDNDFERTWCSIDVHATLSGNHCPMFFYTWHGNNVGN